MPERWSGYALSREPDGRWLAESTLIPGAASRGVSPEDAVAVLREAEGAFLRAWRVSVAVTAADAPGVGYAGA